MFRCAGEALDNATFAETVEFAADLADVAPQRLQAGASPALVSVAAELVARNLLAAIYVYQGNDTLAYQEGLAEARLILKVACSTTFSCCHLLGPDALVGS